MLRNRICYGLLLAGAALLYLFTNTYYTLTLLLLCILLPLLSIGLALACRPGIHISLSAPDTAEKSSAVLSYTFENRGKLPAARIVFLVKLENLLTGSVSSRWVHGTAAGKKAFTAKLALKNAKAGSIVVSTEKIRIYDVFGVFGFPKENLPEQVILVYPNMREEAVHMEKPVEEAGDGSRYAPNRPGMDVSEIFALRDYTPGDDVRKIHWKLSSKLDKTLVRDFSLPLSYSIFLLADLYFESEDAADAVLELYLSLSGALLEAGVSHNLSWYDEGEGEFCVKELDAFEDLEAAAARLLSSCASLKKSAALDYYAASGYYNSRSALVYVTSCPEPDRIADIEAVQPMRTISVYEDGQDEKERDARGESMIRVSVRQAHESGLEIMV